MCGNLRRLHLTKKVYTLHKGGFSGIRNRSLGTPAPSELVGSVWSINEEEVRDAEAAENGEFSSMDGGRVYLI